MSPGASAGIIFQQLAQHAGAFAWVLMPDSRRPDIVGYVHEWFRVRSGCISYVLKIGTAILAAVFLTTGALFLIFGAFSLDSSGGVTNIVTVVAALAAIYLFVRVGKGILRDLRGESSDDNKKTPPPDRSD